MGFGAWGGLRVFELLGLGFWVWGVLQLWRFQRFRVLWYVPKQFAAIPARACNKMGKAQNLQDSGVPYTLIY